MRDQIAKLEAVFQDAHQQRDFQAHQHADDDARPAYSIKLEALRVGEGEKQRDEEKPPTSPTISSMETKRATRPRCDEPREIAADAHGEQVAADDGGKLQDAVAEQVAGERTGDQLVDEPAGGDEEDREKEDDGHRLPL